MCFKPLIELGEVAWELLHSSTMAVSLGSVVFMTDPL